MVHGATHGNVAIAFSDKLLANGTLFVCVILLLPWGQNCKLKPRYVPSKIMFRVLMG